MPSNKIFSGVVLVTCLLITSSTAVYFGRSQQLLKADLEQLQEANHELEAQLRAKPVTQKPSPQAAKEPEVFSDELDNLKVELQALQQTLSEREAQIKALENQIASVPDPAEPEAASEPEKELQPWERFEERMNRMKEEDPERYQRMMDGREKFKTSLKDNVARKSAFLMNLDASKMNEEERENHERLMGLMEKAWEVQERLNQEDLDAKAMYELQSEMRGGFREMSDLLQSERKVAFRQMAESMGYEGEAAGELGAYMDNIVDMTSMRSFFRGMRPPSRPDGAQPPPSSSDSNR